MASITFYQSGLYVFVPSACRYYPTCSEYAKIGLQQHGVLKGCRLTAKRLLRCHPWSRGGYDPVPD